MAGVESKKEDDKDIDENKQELKENSKSDTNTNEKTSIKYDKKTEFICDYCSVAHKIKNRLFWSIKCKHQVSNECATRFVLDEILNSKMPLCPVDNCSHHLTPFQAHSLLGNDFYDIYSKLYNKYCTGRILQFGTKIFSTLENSNDKNNNTNNNVNNINNANNVNNANNANDNNENNSDIKTSGDNNDYVRAQEQESKREKFAENKLENKENDNEIGINTNKPDECYRKCLTPSCNTVVELVSRDHTQLDCPNCGISWCLRCGVAYHEFMTCDDYQEGIRKELLKQQQQQQQQQLQNEKMQQMQQSPEIQQIKKLENFFGQINTFFQQETKKLQQQIEESRLRKKLAVESKLGFTESYGQLFLSVYQNNLDAIKHALNNGADVNKRHPMFGNCSIMHAVTLSATNRSAAMTLEIAQLIDSYGFNGEKIINETISGSNIFQLCCFHGHIELLNYLLKTYKNFNVFYQDSNGIDGLQIAISNKQVEMVEYLLKTVYNKNTDLVVNKDSIVEGRASGGPFHLATTSDSEQGVEIMQLLLTYKANPNICGSVESGLWVTPFHAACMLNATKSLLFMLENNIYPNIDMTTNSLGRKTSLQVALELDCMDAVRLLCIFRNNRYDIESALRQSTNKLNSGISIEKFLFVLKYLVFDEDESQQSQFIDEKMLHKIKDDPKTDEQFDTILSELIQICKNPNHTIADIMKHVSNKFKIEFNIEDDESQKIDNGKIQIPIIECDKMHPMEPLVMELKENNDNISLCCMCKIEKKNYSHVCLKKECRKKVVCSDCYDAWDKAWTIERFAQSRMYTDHINKVTGKNTQLADKVEQVVNNASVMRIV